MKNFLATSLALITFGCSGGGGQGWTKPSDPERITAPTVPAGDVATLVAGNTSFATALHQQLATQSGNLFYSPYSISLNLSEVNASGSQPAALATALDFGLPQDRLNAAFDALDLDLTSITGKTQSGAGFQFEETSASWGTLAAPQSYVTTLEQFYGTQILSGTDPGQTLQTWQTAGSPGPQLPVSLIGACDGFLVTLVNFDAAWQSPFVASNTQPGPFTTQAGGTVTVPFMSQTATFSFESSGTPAIELPYGGGRLSMLIALPDDLATFEASLTPSTIAGLLAGLAPTNVQLSLPKFSFTDGWSVLGLLQQLGLELSGGGTWEIFHSAEIQVSETGTQATAVTTTSHSPSAIAASTPFAVNKPFVYFILDQTTGTVLFIGRIVDPTQTGS
jgi:serpin B